MLLLAAMHYYENAGRPQKRNKRRTSEFAIPRHKEGGYIVRKVLSACTYNYVDNLFGAIGSSVSSSTLKQLCQAQ